MALLVSTPTASDTVNESSFASIVASISSNAAQTQTRPRGSQATTSTRSNSRSTITQSATRTTLSTRTRASTTSSITSAASTSRSSASQSTATSSNLSTSSTTRQAAATTSANNSGAALSKSQECHSVSCSSGLQAAIAVPIVVVVLALLVLLFFCMRRRKRRAAETEEEKIARRKKKWSQKYGALPFDNGNKNSQTGARQDMRASPQSSKEGVTVYRDPEKTERSSAMGRFREDIPSMAADNPVQRSSKTPSPPTYGANKPATTTTSMPSGPTTTATTTSTVVRPTGTTNTTSGPTTTASNTGQDPFLDVRAVSPIDNSPFIDSTAERGISRQSGRHDDASSFIAGSDAGSIHDVQVGRSASVLSTGRILNVRKST